MPKTYEYEQGLKAKENFKRRMQALFQPPKDAVPETENPR